MLLELNAEVQYTCRYVINLVSFVCSHINHATTFDFDHQEGDASHL